MLAWLNKIPGVAAAKVDASGRHFVIQLAEDTASALAMDPILQMLGSNSRFVGDSRSGNAIGGFDPEEIWMDVHNIRGLSLLEARILAADWGGKAARASRLPTAQGSGLVDLLRMELMREIDTIHAKGSTSDRNWYIGAFPAAFERAIAGMKSLSPAKAASLRQSLLRSLNR